MKHMKSIKNKIVLTVSLLVGISLLVLGGISTWMNLSSTNDTLKQTLTQTAAVAAERVSWELQAYKNIAMETGAIARLSSSATSLEDKKSIIDQKVKHYNFQRGNILTADGNSIFDGNNYSDRDYFQAAIKGTPFISEPLVSKVTGELTIIIAAPLWKDGIADTSIVGVVYFVPKETFLNEIVADLKVSPNGGAYLLDEHGDTIAHEDIELVRNLSNTVQDAKSDPSLAALAALETKMVNGETGFDTYKYNGVKKFLAFAPLDGEEGWSIGVNAPISDFMGSTIRSIIITIIILVLALVISLMIVIALSVRIADPIKQCAFRLQKLSEGDLKSAVPEIQSMDETGVLAQSTKNIVSGFNEIIGDIDYLLTSMSNGNFAIKSQAANSYIGDFHSLIESLRGINTRLSNTLSQINIAADQVSSGSDQVSSGAQALSQGATEQASSIEELAATINEISNQISKNAGNAINASNKATHVEEEALTSNTRMQEMLAAMSEISSTSSQIGKIIKDIEDIAFQTNILALNAAVEAARAGEAGKGFAVVADEVRNLASKSAEASKNSSELIESSLKAVEQGTQIADHTASSLDRVLEGIKEMAAIVTEISTVSDDQNQQMSQVTIGVDQISSVVQTNSATAEESAAASEELSSQAQMLKDLVSQFQLKKD